MQTRILGKTGLSVSEVGLGCAVFGLRNCLEPWSGSKSMDKKAAATIARAVDLGYNYIDTAPAYEDSEERLGTVLPPYRDRIILATKISASDWTVQGVQSSIELSRGRLQTDIIDIVQFHGGSYYHGEERNIIESGALDELRRLRDLGIVRFIGFTTEASSGGAQALIETGAFDTVQVQYSLMYQNAHDLEQNEGIIPIADSIGLGIITMRTMTSGRFHRLMKQCLPNVSEEKLGEILLNYVLSNQAIDVALVGMTDPVLVERNNSLSENVSGRIDLTALHNGYVN